MTNSVFIFISLVVNEYCHKNTDSNTLKLNFHNFFHRKFLCLQKTALNHFKKFKTLLLYRKIYPH